MMYKIFKNWEAIIMTLKDAYGEFIETKKMAGCAPKTISDYSSFIGMYVWSHIPHIHAYK